ncbi:MAG TPA: hypothetical protein VF627_09935 [Abditibacterium sp.]
MRKHLLGLWVVLGSSAAWAQPQVTGKLPPLEQLPLRLQLQLDPKLPAYPKLEPSQPARVQIRVLPTHRGPLFQLEVVRKSRAEVLEAVVAAMGERCVVDPVLNRSFYQTAVLRALSLEDLLVEASSTGIEWWKSSSGTYFFTYKPDPAVQKMLDDLAKRKDNLVAPRRDPFNVWSLPLRRPEPQPDWGTLPFNGRDVFIVPLPAAPKAPTPNKP